MFDEWTELALEYNRVYMTTGGDERAARERLVKRMKERGLCIAYAHDGDFESRRLVNPVEDEKRTGWCRDCLARQDKIDAADRCEIDAAGGYHEYMERYAEGP